MTSNSYPDEFAGLAKAKDPVFGARSFNVNHDGMLTGVTFPQVWELGVNDARCWKAEPSLNYSQAYYDCDEEVDPPNDVPHALDVCTHGFYAYYEGSNDYRDSVRVEAVVRGTGETLIGSRGFRTVKAQILALHIPETLPESRSDAIRLNYWAVPLFGSFEEMVSVFRPGVGQIEINNNDGRND